MSVESPTVHEAHDFGITGLWYRAGGDSGTVLYYRVVGTPSKSAHTHYTVTIEIPSADGDRVRSMPMFGHERLHRTPQ